MELDKKEAELKYLFRRCLIFLDFFYKKYGQLEIYKNAKVGIQKEYEKQNLRGLRAMSKDQNSWLQIIPIDDAMELGVILKREIGEDLNLTGKKRLQVISKILKRGKILNLEEYELLHNRSEEIFADPEQSKDMERINSLLTAFDIKHESN